MRKTIIIFTMLLLLLVGCTKADDNGSPEAVIKAHFRDLFDKSITNEAYAENYFAPNLREQTADARNDLFTTSVYKDYPRSIEIHSISKIEDNRYKVNYDFHITYEDGSVGTSPDAELNVRVIQIEGKWYMNSGLLF